MSYSNSFPQQRPTLNLDFANSGKLDSRISYSRSSSGTAFSSERHLSSENTQTNSDSLSDWLVNSDSSGPTATLAGGQVGPDGSTANAAVVTGIAGTSLKGIWEGFQNTEQTISWYAKEGTHRYIQLSVTGDSSKFVNFDLNGAGAKVANGSGVTASITASANGYLRCAVKLTVPDTYVYITLQDSLGAGRENQTSSTGTVFLHGIQTTTLGDATNVAAYNATTTQLHREFAPTLKTSAANEPRFEYAADGQSVGTALGLLVESQSSNLYPNSSDMTGNSGYRVNVDSNVAIGPTGGLTADALRLDANDASQHYRQYNFTAASSTAYTFSVYVKAAGLNYIAVRSNNLFSSNFTYFNLSNGTVEGSPAMTSTIESVGNGWHRISVNATTTGAGTASFIIYITDSASSTTVATGDSYRAVLGTGIQVEASSAPSSLISTSGSTATRSADSCSVALSDVGITSGQDLTAVVEGVTEEIAGAALIGFDDGSSSNYARISRHANNNHTFDVRTNASSQAVITLGSSSSATSFAFRVENNNIGAAAGGSSVTTDTSATLGLMTTMQIGSAYWATQANGTISRVSIYSEPLTDTNLTVLSS